ncbi:MAG: hypothetical protein P8Y29_05010 [Gemmatimonadota bacterium]
MSDTLLILIGLWVLLAAVWLAVYPLFGGAAESVPATVAQRRELETEKARLLEEIHELQLDYATGKLSDEDHAALEARLKSRAVEIMQQLEATAGRSSG